MLLYKIQIELNYFDNPEEKIKENFYFSQYTCSLDYQMKFYGVKKLSLIKKYNKYNFIHDNDNKTQLISKFDKKNLKYFKENNFNIDEFKFNKLFLKKNIKLLLEVFNHEDSFYGSILNFLNKEDKIFLFNEENKIYNAENDLMTYIKENINKPKPIIVIYLLQFTLFNLYNNINKFKCKNDYFKFLILMYISNIYYNGIYINNDNETIIKMFFILLDIYPEFKNYFEKFLHENFQNQNYSWIYRILKNLDFKDGLIYDDLFKLESLSFDKEPNFLLFHGDLLNDRYFGLKNLDSKQVLKCYIKSREAKNKISHLRILMILNNDFFENLKIYEEFTLKNKYTKLYESSNEISHYDTKNVLNFLFYHNFYLNDLKIIKLKTIDFIENLKKSEKYLKKLFLLDCKDYYEIYILLNLFLKNVENIKLINNYNIKSKLFSDKRDIYIFYKLKLKFLKLKNENDFLWMYVLLEKCLFLMKNYENSLILFINLSIFFAKEITRLGLDFISNKIYEMILSKIFKSEENEDIKEKLYYMLIILINTKNNSNNNFDFAKDIIFWIFKIPCTNYKENLINFKTIKILKKYYNIKIDLQFFISNNLYVNFKTENNDFSVKYKEIIDKIKSNIIFENFNTSDDINLKDINFSKFNEVSKGYNSNKNITSNLIKTEYNLVNKKEIKEFYDFKKEYNNLFDKKLKKLTKCFNIDSLSFFIEKNNKNSFIISNFDKNNLGGNYDIIQLENMKTAKIIINNQKVRVKEFTFYLKNLSFKENKSKKILKNIKKNLHHFIIYNPFYVNILGYAYEEIGSYEDTFEVKIYIIYEYFSSNLLKFLNENKLLVEEKVKLIYNLIYAVNFWHSINLTHKNLFQEYIFINEKLDIKIYIPIHYTKIKKNLYLNLINLKHSIIPKKIYNKGLNQFIDYIKDDKLKFHKKLDLHFWSFYILLILINNKEILKLDFLEKNWKKYFKKIKLIKELKKLFLNFFTIKLKKKNKCPELISEIEKNIIIYYNDIKIISKNFLFQKMFDNLIYVDTTNYNNIFAILPKNLVYIGALGNNNYFPIGTGKIYYNINYKDIHTKSKEYIMDINFSSEKNVTQVIYKFNFIRINFNFKRSELDFKYLLQYNNNEISYNHISKLFFFNYEKLLLYINILKDKSLFSCEIKNKDKRLTIINEEENNKANIEENKENIEENENKEENKENKVEKEENKENKLEEVINKSNIEEENKENKVVEEENKENKVKEENKENKVVEENNKENKVEEKNKENKVGEENIKPDPKNKVNEDLFSKLFETINYFNEEINKGNIFKLDIDIFGNYIYKSKIKNKKDTTIFGSIDPNKFFQTKILTEDFLFINNLWNYSLINIKKKYKNLDKIKKFKKFHKINLEINFLSYKKIYLIDFTQFIFIGKIKYGNPIKGIFIKNNDTIYNLKDGEFPRNNGKIFDSKNKDLIYKGDFFNFKKNGFGYLYKNNKKYIFGFFKENNLTGKGVIYDENEIPWYKAIFLDNKIKYLEFFKKNVYLFSITFKTNLTNIYKINLKKLKKFTGFLYSDLYEKKDINIIKFKYQEPFYIKLDNGDILIGNISKDIGKKYPVGYCKLKKINEQSIYLGKFDANGMNGQQVFLKENPNDYKSIKSNFIYDINNELIANKLSIIKYNNGNIFIGNLEEGKFNGYGKYLIKNENKSLFGNFTNNILNGYGIEKVKDKYKYKGDFINNIKNNFGILYINKEIIHGFWINNKLIKIYQKKPNLFLNNLKFDYIISEVKFNLFSEKWFMYGYCIVINESKNYEYVGQIKNDKITGFGKLKIGNNNYKGEFKNGFYGNFGYLNTDIFSYCGEFYKSLKNGNGILIDKNNIYEGKFKNDIKEGLFIITNLLLKSNEYGIFKKNLRDNIFVLNCDNNQFIKIFEFDNLLKIIKIK